MATLVLYLAPGSSSMAPHIALNEVGAAFEMRPLSLARKEHRSPDYLRLNPEGKVPTLLVDDRPLFVPRPASVERPFVLAVPLKAERPLNAKPLNVKPLNATPLNAKPFVDS